MFGDPENNPKHWNKASLSNVISNANNGMARRGNNAEGSIVLRLVELQDGFIDYSSPNRIVLTEAEKKRYLLKNRDFLFARVNGNPENVGRCAEFSDIGEPVYHNDHIIRVHFDENLINGRFASALLNNTYGKRQMAGQIKTSAGQYTINQEGIGAIVTVLPPLGLQNRFAAFVTEVDKSKFCIQKSLAASRKLWTVVQIDAIMNMDFSTQRSL
jgi:type I restriction enzyme, S subunit